MSRLFSLETSPATSKMALLSAWREGKWSGRRHSTSGVERGCRPPTFEAFLSFCFRWEIIQTGLRHAFGSVQGCGLRSPTEISLSLPLFCPFFPSPAKSTEIGLEGQFGQTKENFGETSFCAKTAFPWHMSRASSFSVYVWCSFVWRQRTNNVWQQSVGSDLLVLQINLKADGCVALRRPFSFHFYVENGKCCFGFQILLVITVKALLFLPFFLRWSTVSVSQYGRMIKYGNRLRFSHVGYQFFPLFRLPIINKGKISLFSFPYCHFFPLS